MSIRPTFPPDALASIDDIASYFSDGRLGMVMDFDGTLSEIAQRPEDAVLYPGCRESLQALSESLPLTAIVSGRAARDINAKIGLHGLVYIGNHGAERFVGGQSVYEPKANEFRHHLESIMADLRSKVHARGVVWEDKGLSLAVHYRAAEDPARAERDLQTAVANAPHRDVLDIFWGKMILEIRAPTGLNKGHAVRRLVQEWELERLIFLGDDTTDIDAVLAVKEMAERGLIEGFSIVVLHDEAPPRMVEECAYSLQGVPAVSEFLDLSARLSVRK